MTVEARTDSGQTAAEAIKEKVWEQGRRAKAAARQMAKLSGDVKNQALSAMAEALVAREKEILEANSLDVAAAEKKGISGALLDRLTLTTKRVGEMAEGLRVLVSLPDPVGEVTRMWLRPNGLQVGKTRVPLGVVGIIYEARPNVTVDAAGLCLKTGNAILLRGGSEAFNSNLKIASILAETARENGIPDGAIQLVETTDREAVNVMLKMNQYLDVLVPRGGAGLIQMVINNATVPVIETGVGNCHTYVDADADLEMAEKIVINAKTQRPGVCNALETLLVHRRVAGDLLRSLGPKLIDLKVELRGCPETAAILPAVKPATEADWGTEYLDLILAIRVIGSLDEALDHIARYGSGHSEAIITRDYQKAQRFLKEVDAAAVYVNASTRFTDGYQFGFGAELGISTQKLHARGPMGLEELTTYKYIIYGDGQIRC